MKVEFLAEGSQDCPLLRLYDFEFEEAVSLRQIFVSLRDGARDLVHLEGESGFESMGGCQLTLRLGKRDLGIVQKAKAEFDCVLTQEGWDDMACRLEPFCQPGCSGYQWLNEDGNVSLLFSKAGQW